MIDPLIRALEKRVLEGDAVALEALRHAWRRADALDGARGLATHLQLKTAKHVQRMVWSEGGTWVEINARNSRGTPISVTVLVDDLDRVYRVATGNEARGFRPGLTINGRTIYLDGDCVAEAIDRYLAWVGIQVDGPRTIRVGRPPGTQATGPATVYVDPSGSIDLGPTVRVPVAYTEGRNA